MNINRPNIRWLKNRKICVNSQHDAIGLKVLFFIQLEFGNSLLLTNCVDAKKDM